MDNKLIGSWGEKIAKNYLKSKGYVILETNWRYHHQELDIIAYKDTLIGVEVKTRNGDIGLAFTVLKAKQVARLRLALNAFCHLHGFNYKKARLDLLIIKVKDKNTINLRHHQDI